MITATQVLTLISLFQINGHVYHFDRLKSAAPISEAIAKAVNAEQDVPITESYLHDAALLVTYVIYESAMHTCASGDGGKSWGILQLQGVDKTTACDPYLASVIWIRMAKNAQAYCSANSDETNLAAIASGYCDRGLKLVKYRYEIYHDLVNKYNEQNQ
jgi:hypothetical protein